MEKGAPTTLQQARRYFADYRRCHRLIVKLRWPAGVTCPRCGSDKVTYLENARVWKCYGAHERTKFSLKIGTKLEGSAVGLDKWLAAVWMIVNCKTRISSYAIARALGVTQKTAGFMDRRIEFALRARDLGKLDQKGKEKRK